MTRYVATVNVPGYLPMDDDPPTFDDPASAWAWLEEERAEQESAAILDGGEYAVSDCLATLRATVSSVRHGASVGTVYGPTPGYDGDHDLGLAYSVSVAEEEQGI
jgi:hypothetical protein